MGKILFGPAGNSESFGKMGYKKSTDIPAYLAHFNLRAFEYQCGHGVRTGLGTAGEIGAVAKEAGVLFSVHAPYYISLASVKEETRANSVEYLSQSAALVRALGGHRVIFHPGSITGRPREEVLTLAMQTLQAAMQTLLAAGYTDIQFCPEVMGKNGQLGTLEEVIALCEISENLVPCVDFGHLNARTQGGLATQDDFKRAINLLQTQLGERGNAFHAHFSKIEYTAGGEKRHLTFEDEVFGPSYEHFINACIALGATPTVICESAGTQAEDAATMQRYYEGVR
ncbi:TIM barrel protein [Ruminococcaceae bacterium OttesenSCG-928-N02]|nr:TIM barrel protein [Ruminococcaceae bacterium OttesenSCG-928-N02]